MGSQKRILEDNFVKNRIDYKIYLKRGPNKKEWEETVRGLTDKLYVVKYVDGDYNKTQEKAAMTKLGQENLIKFLIDTRNKIITTEEITLIERVNKKVEERNGKLIKCSIYSRDSEEIINNEKVNCPILVCISYFEGNVSPFLTHLFDSSSGIIYKCVRYKELRMANNEYGMRLIK